MLHNINQGQVSNNNITTPACKKNSGLRTFPSSACRLWNTLDVKLRLLSHTNFKTYLNFTVVGILLLIILRFGKLFGFISGQLINIVIPVDYYANLVGRSHR